MNEKLSELIAGASGRIEAAAAQKEAERKQRDADEKEKDWLAFKRYVENGLGVDVLAALEPVTFQKNFLQNSMTFSQNSRYFRLKQQTGGLVQLEETNETQATYRMVGHQFNLSNPDAKTTFLHALGEALRHSANL